MELSIGLIGFGNVGKALVELIDSKTDTLRSAYDLNISVMGIATRRQGIVIDEHGLDLSRTLEASAQGNLARLHVGAPVLDVPTFIRRVPAQLIVEISVLNPQTGQPATDYIRQALQLKRHVVTANKGPVAFAYRELKALAEKNGCGFLYESTVMDGVPVFGLVRETLLAAQIQRISGILNSTTNNILTRMEGGMPMADAIREMQDAGLAEADPAFDVDGWDAAAKIAILANVLMDADLRPTDVDRTGIGALSVEEVRQVARTGQAIRLMCVAEQVDGAVRATVKPATLPLTDPLARVTGTGNLLRLETDMIGQLSIGEGEAGPHTTAYGILVDIINIARGHYR